MNHIDESSVIEKINSFFVEEFEANESDIKPEAILKDALDLDSLDYVDLVVVIENNFHFKVKAEDFKNIITIQDFYNYILGRLKAQNAAA